MRGHRELLNSTELPHRVPSCPHPFSAREKRLALAPPGPVAPPGASDHHLRVLAVRPRRSAWICCDVCEAVGPPIRASPPCPGVSTPRRCLLEVWPAPRGPFRR